MSDASSSSLNPDDSFVRLLMARDEPNSPKERTIFPVPDLQIWQPCSIQLWRRSVVKSGVRVSQVKPSSCFTRLEKSVLPSIFDKSLSSSMTWNLQSYPTTVLNERTRHFRGGGWKHTVTHTIHIFREKTPYTPGPLMGAMTLTSSSVTFCHLAIHLSGCHLQTIWNSMRLLQFE